jgi:ABC-2 type transport system permease protein
MNWTSPLFLNENIADSVGVTPLLNSSGESWLHTGTDIQPDFDLYPESGFSIGNALQSYKLAVALQGSFPSYFSSRQDPRLVELQEPIEAKDKAISMEGAGDNQVDFIENVPPEPVIKKSPNTSRLIVVGSSEFINDTVINLSRSTGQDRFLNNLQFVQNIIDWSVEDDDLLSIRSRGSHARLLVPMTRQEQRFWEWLNYGLALAALISISLLGSTRRHKEKPIELAKEVNRT